MSRNPNPLANLSLVEDRLAQLLAQIESATGSLSISGLGANGPSPARAADFGSGAISFEEWRERLEQQLSVTNQTGERHSETNGTQDELRSLTQMLERYLESAPREIARNEALLNGWREQLDRIEEKLEQLQAVRESPARFE